MKQSLFLIAISFFTVSLCAQNIKHPNENADTIKKNAFGINVSPFLASVFGAQSIQPVPYALYYKHYGQRFNIRLSAEVSPDILTKGYESFYNSDRSWITYPSYMKSGDIVMMNDSVTLKRQFLRDNSLIEINAGLEKAKKTRMGTWIIGGELNMGYLKKDETYVYREYLSTRLDDTEYTEIPFLNPNTAQAYVKGDYLKLGLNFIIGFEWALTKHLNLSATVNPNVHTLIELSETYSDLENKLLHTKPNTYELDLGFVNIGAFLKF
jgi:hypothetical protein